MKDEDELAHSASFGALSLNDDEDDLNIDQRSRSFSPDEDEENFGEESEGDEEYTCTMDEAEETPAEIHAPEKHFPLIGNNLHVIKYLK